MSELHWQNLDGDSRHHCLMDEVIEACMLLELLSAAQLSSDVIKLPPAFPAPPIWPILEFAVPIM